MNDEDTTGALAREISHGGCEKMLPGQENRSIELGGEGEHYQRVIGLVLQHLTRKIR